MLVYNVLYSVSWGEGRYIALAAPSPLQQPHILLQVIILIIVPPSTTVHKSRALITFIPSSICSWNMNHCCDSLISFDDRNPLCSTFWRQARLGSRFHDSRKRCWLVSWATIVAMKASIKALVRFNNLWLLYVWCILFYYQGEMYITSVHAYRAKHSPACNTYAHCC